MDTNWLKRINHGAEPEIPGSAFSYSTASFSPQTIKKSPIF
ncbi:hypothetical protein SAMD00020551_0486 [Mesobacillus selenatarsenatis SF-1]|uniref:Uncharacterized protein n=1 Tax=Mesobacillus selenatarsenatis (strain DSM 18680 / JCM 14380 / FERM P-15431 / SF-1) TaxID=1321606 RepID=A0A0A8WXK1_MESS1|nr:hypothetical protein SAMD00020551_0486 [Mesobacillus selenatarsenatis SF-1]